MRGWRPARSCQLATLTAPRRVCAPLLLLLSQAVEMLGEALKFWDNQRGFEVSIGEATLERSVEVYKKREVQFKDRLKKYKEVRPQRRVKPCVL